MKVREIVTKAPVTVGIDATIEQAASAMDRAAVGAVVVLEAGRPVGILTDRDLVVRAMSRRLPPDARVDGVMTSGIVCVDADAELFKVADMLSEHPFRRLPVVEKDVMIGMVSLDDLLVRLANDLQRITKAVAAQLLFGHPEPQLPTTLDS